MLGFGLAKILGFPDVLGQIVEPFLRFTFRFANVFQVAVTHCPPSADAPLSSPIEGALEIRFLFDQVVDEVNPVEILGRHIGLGQIQDGSRQVKGGADLVALGKENGYEFSQEELNTGWKELQESDEGLTEFELDVVAGGCDVCS